MKKRLTHLPSGLLASAVLLVLGVVLGGLLRGAAGAAGAAAGVGLVAASYTISSLVVAWADLVNPRLIMPVGLITYVLKIILIGVVMAAIAATGWSGLPAMGVAIITSVLGWITAQAIWTWRARIPYVDIDAS
jgi:ATP synthase protein I